VSSRIFRAVTSSQLSYSLSCFAAVAGEGTQIGAGTLVISDLPAHSVAVGVPARIIGSFVDVTQQPSVEMDQMISPKNLITFESEGI
jgi:serine O-acetyltransferase